jgi:hypothetical protein
MKTLFDTDRPSERQKYNAIKIRINQPSRLRLVSEIFHTLIFSNGTKIYIRTFHTCSNYLYKILFSNFAYKSNQTKANEID